MLLTLGILTFPAPLELARQHVSFDNPMRLLTMQLQCPLQMCNPIASKPPVYIRIVIVLVNLMMWTTSGEILLLLLKLWLLDFGLKLAKDLK